MEMKYFCAYHSYLDAMRRLGDAERGRLFTALLEYSKTGAAQDLRGNEGFVFDALKCTIDEDKEKYAGTCRTNRENGKKRALSKTSEKAVASESDEKSDRFLDTPKKAVASGKDEKENEKEEEKRSKREEEKEKENIPPGGGIAPAPAREAAAPAAAEGEETTRDQGIAFRDPGVASVIADYASRVNPSASPRCLAELEAFARAMGPEVCRRAIDIALDERKATWSYIRAILRDKQAKGVKSLADWEALEVKRAPAPMPDKPGEADKRARDDMEQLREIMARERALMAREREAGE